MFDVEGARKAGYSDAEIAGVLSRRLNFDLEGARSAGYSDGEVIAQLSKRASIPGQQTPAAAKEAGLLDQAVGAGEAALSAITGATGGTLGAVGGALGAAAGAIAAGQFGTRQAADRIEQAAAEGMQSMTYMPRTQAGQGQAAALGRVMNDVGIPVAGAAMGLRAPPGAMGAGARALQVPAAAVLDRAATALPAAVRDAPARIAAAVRPAQQATPGTLGSVGAAGADMATQRTMAAQQLPVPVRITSGQASRNFEQLRFEGETAKDPRNGAALREFADQQRADLLKNFDAFVDMSGAEAPDVVAAGRSVTGALTQGAARDKAAIRVAYKEAEKAGEMAAPVDLRSLVAYLNEAAPEAATAPLLTTARAQAVRLGIAREEGGRLVMNSAETMPGDSLMNVRPSAGVTLKTAETFRQAINRNTGFELTNIRQATIIKGLVDQATENQGGDKYKAARALRRKFAEKYEDRAIIADLITNRKGMADPKVAADKVFQRSILQASPDDVLFLRRTLQGAGPDGVQAWRELQGATLRHLRDEATRGVGSDQRGNPLISPAGLDRAVQALDKNGRLPILFGKQGAQQLRDIADIAKVVNTVPPGALNTSNTASVLLAALTEAGVTGSMTGLPVPVLSGLRAIALQVKDRRIQQRVQAALRNEALRQQKAKANAADFDIQAPGTATLQRSSVKIIEPPKTAARDYASDYPTATAEPNGSRLATDIDGRPLTAPIIAGRRFVGGADEPVGAAESAIAGRSLGATSREVPASEIGGDAGRYVRRVGQDGEAVREILVRQGLDDRAKGGVYRHELGHLIDDLTFGGGIDTAGIRSELAKLYHDLNAPFRSGKGKWTPESDGYKGALADRELVAEAIRAYLTDPGYIKSVAPKTAARIRKAVNENPNINNVIQFNELTAPIGAGILGYLFLKSQSDDKSD